MQPVKKIKYQYVQKRTDLVRGLGGVFGQTLLTIYDEIVSGIWRNNRAQDPQLPILYRSGKLAARIRISQLADSCGVGTSCVQESLQAMEKLGWVQRLVKKTNEGNTLYCIVGTWDDEGEVRFQDLWLDAAISYCYDLAVFRGYVEANTFAYRAHSREQAPSLVLSKLGKDLVKDLMRTYVRSVLTDVELKRELPDVVRYSPEDIPTVLPYPVHKEGKRARYRGEDSPTSILDKIRTSKVTVSLDVWLRARPTLVGEGCPPLVLGGGPLEVSRGIDNLGKQTGKENYCSASRNSGQTPSGLKVRDPRGEREMKQDPDDFKQDELEQDAKDPSPNSAPPLPVKETAASRLARLEALGKAKAAVGAEKVAKRKAAKEALDPSLKRNVPEDVEKLARHFRAVWSKEMASSFPGLPDTWLKGAKKNAPDSKGTIAYTLAKAYDMETLTSLIQYVIRCWESVNTRYLKGCGQFPTLTLVSKFHDSLVKEAYLYSRYLTLKERQPTSSAPKVTGFSLKDMVSTESSSGELLQLANSLKALGVKL